MNRRNTLRLYCFSPPVMLATFAIEIVFALYTLWRYKLSPISRLVVLILICLAVFQGTEFLLCGGIGVDGGTWSRIGYSSITLLPPLGLHLAHTIARKKSRILVPLAYLTGAAFIYYFAFVTAAISGHTCYANYAVFDTKGALSSMLYGLYYYGWMLISAGLSYIWAKRLKSHTKSALYALAIGYAAFILPTTTVNLIDPSTLAAIPSIMCGFAVILAFVLVGKVTPEAAKIKKH